MGSSRQQVQQRFNNHVPCHCFLCHYQPCTGSVCHLWHCCCSSTSSGGRSCSCVYWRLWWLWLWWRMRYSCDDWWLWRMWMRLWMRHLLHHMHAASSCVHHLHDSSTCVHHLHAASSRVHHLHAASSRVHHLYNTNLRRMWMWRMRMPLMGCRSCIWISHGSSDLAIFGGFHL